jgi:hypothetical protein
MFRKVLIIFVLYILSASGLITAQTLPVGMPVLEDLYRREQLRGNNDSLISFTIRPLFTGTNLNTDPNPLGDTFSAEQSLIRIKSRYQWAGNKASLKFLPFSSVFKYNSEFPYGWNDASMIPAKGLQSLHSFGVSASYGPLSIQLKPEYIHAENPEFEGFPSEQYDVVWAKYYDNYFNVSDITEWYPEAPYQKLLWGQSSIRLNFDPVSVGLSNENLWWGPGKRSSLLMSNNAPGFKHITLNTSRPVQTGIGSFEAQIIAGRLENSGVLPPQVNRVYDGRSLYKAKRDDWRYLSGMVITYQPKWVPGLFVGTSRVSQMYNQDAGSSPADFIPLLQAFENKEAVLERDRYSTLFFRWIWKESGTEIYGEYGHQGRKKIVDLLKSPETNAAYLLGISKQIPVKNRSGEYIQTSLEFTELQQTSVPLQGGWYTNSLIRQGYTHRGQVLGAGIGPGSNLQSLDISWYKGLKHIGLQFERYVHNNDFYYQMFINPPDFRKHYVDMSTSLSADWDYKNLIFSAGFSMIRALNYGYVLYNRPPEYFVTGWDRLNYQVKFGVMYRF